MRREVYLPRLWTDKPVKLKGETLTIIKQKRGGEGEKRGNKKEEGSVALWLKPLAQGCIGSNPVGTG